MTSITVELGERSYPIRIGRGALAELPALLTSLRPTGAVAICTDSNVAPLCAERVAKLAADAGFRSVTSVMPAGEENKRIQRIEEFIGDFLKAGMDRGSLVIALGGGVVGDVAGYAAASFMRGVPFVQIPTTIVAQVDSSVGGKTGVNHPYAKNIIGAFHQPAAVLIDLDLLATLPPRELRAGLAEVIKHGVIADEDLFAFMEREAGRILALDLDAIAYPVQRSCEIKGAIVSADERESGVRAHLNYGHTFGHGIEASTGYTRFLHGEAVALGMVCAAELARRLGMADNGFCERQRACIAAYGLPVRFPELDVETTLEAMRHDKKVRAGVMKFILADGIGHALQRTDVAENDARAALASIAS